MLNQFQQRNKWQFPSRNLEINDVVILRDDLSPPTQWALGVVSEVFPGRDGLVRVVSVRTAKSQFRRGVKKLIYLPTDGDCVRSYHSLICGY